MKINAYVKLFIIFVLFITVISVIVFFTDHKVKYPLNDCVTYFDNDARYQLVDVGNEYHILDASEGKSLCSNIKYYLYQNNKLYLIYNKAIGVENSQEIYAIFYGVLDIESGKFTETNSLSSVSNEFKYNKDAMIELPRRSNSFVEWITDFLPRKLRKR